MKVMTGISSVEWETCAIAIGKFEGLHAGHHKLIRMINNRQQQGEPSVVFTFDKSPRFFFGQRDGMLFTREERRHVLEQWDLQYLIECPFTKELAGMEAECFVEEILLRKLRVGYLAVGQDFHFGRERQGSVELLQTYAKQGLFTLDIADKEVFNEAPVSSTRVREELAGGNVERVSRMLGYPFFMEGTVVEGNHLGRTWGIPTANILLPEEKLLPPNGVYFARVQVEGEIYNGITNIGHKPTIGNDYAKGAETYLYQFNGDLYGKNIRVELYSFQRPEQKFDSLEALIERLKYDVSCGEAYFRSIRSFNGR